MKDKANNITYLDVSFMSGYRALILLLLVIAMLLIAVLGTSGTDEVSAAVPVVTPKSQKLKTEYIPMTGNRQLPGKSDHSSVVNPFSSSTSAAVIKDDEVAPKAKPFAELPPPAPTSTFRAEGYPTEPRVEGFLGVPPRP